VGLGDGAWAMLCVTVWLGVMVLSVLRAGTKEDYEACRVAYLPDDACPGCQAAEVAAVP
jgi:hypothetical protein